MSYDEATGWTRLSGRQVERYYRHVPGQPDSLLKRLAAAGLDWYRDDYDGLHIRALPGRVWTLLSGEPSRFADPPATPPTSPEWISVTDLGAALDPPRATSTVLKLLRDEGLLARVDRSDRPTAAAAGLYCEERLDPAATRDGRSGAVQRRWSYEVLERLRRRVRDQAPGPHQVPQPHERPTGLIPMTVRFPAKCGVCGSELPLGNAAVFDAGRQRICCRACADAQPSTVTAVAT